MSARRTYRWDGRDLPSVTSILATVVAKPGLISWAAKVSAEAATAAMRGGATPDIAVAAGKSAPTAGRDAGGARGTDVHRVAHHLALDLPAPSVSPAAEPYVASLRDWWAQHQPVPIMAEAMVVSQQHRYAGTLDAIWDLAGRRTVLVDLKTSAFLGPEVGLQLAAYRYADIIALPDGTAVPMPDVHAACVLHVGPDKATLIDVDAGADAWAAFRAASILARYLWEAGR